MTSSQIEYCGECKYYEQCMSLVEAGHLTACRLVETEIKRESMKFTVDDVLGVSAFFGLVYLVCWLCNIAIQLGVGCQ